MTVYTRRKHAIVELEDRELLEAIHEVEGDSSVYVCAYPPEWSDDVCKKFMLVVSEWILAGQIPPRPV